MSSESELHYVSILRLTKGPAPPRAASTGLDLDLDLEDVKVAISKSFIV